MRPLSKSKLIAWRQCPKRLWLEVHQPELRLNSSANEARFEVGYQVGDIARQLYDSQQRGQLIDVGTEGFEGAFARTQQLLQNDAPIFEAGFQAAGALAFADVLLPSDQGRWRMVEVKSSTSVKDYHLDDLTIQTWIAQQAGLNLSAVALAHINSRWVYPGQGDYQGLLVEQDLSAEIFSRTGLVGDWLKQAQSVSQQSHAPDIAPGKHCNSPFECGFTAHCHRQLPTAQYPVYWLPRIQSPALKNHLEIHAIGEMSEVPDSLLNETQLRVKQATLTGQVYFDQQAAADALAAYSDAGYFLDFETIQFAVPIWTGTRPYQQIPFQFSLHHRDHQGHIEHTDFLDLSGQDPSHNFAHALIEACGKQGPVFVYNAAFETSRITELAERFPPLAPALSAINQRVVDLLPICRRYYYHPGQQGSWSIKAVLPNACPDLSYQQLDGVQDGGMAMNSYLEAIAPTTSTTRKTEIERQLLAYCQLDTWAMVRLWALFVGKVV